MSFIVAGFAFKLMLKKRKVEGKRAVVIWVVLNFLRQQTEDAVFTEGGKLIFEEEDRRR